MKTPGIVVTSRRQRTSIFRMEIMIAIQEMMSSFTRARVVKDPLKPINATIKRVRTRKSGTQTVFKVCICIYQAGLALGSRIVSSLKHLRESTIIVPRPLFGQFACN